MAPGIFERLFGAKTWHLDTTALPWADRPSLLEFVQARLRDGGPLEPLPDEAAVHPPGRVRWVAGGLDGAFGHHVGTSRDDERIERVVRSLRAVLHHPAPAKLVELYEVVQADLDVGNIDGVLERLGRPPTPSLDRLRSLGRWLMTRAPDRTPLKLGIALVGATGPLEGSDVEVLGALGRSEEFTLYVAVALSRGLEDPEPQLFALAQHVNGWGRIALVERLARTSDPAIRDWMLRRGFHNSIMDEYLAVICARTGDLRRALAAEAVDEELLAGAGDLISAMIHGEGGPAEGIAAYADARVALADYLRHVCARPGTVRQYLTVRRIRCHLEATAGPREGWGAIEEDTVSRCEGFEARPHFPELVVSLLRDAPDEAEVHAAIQASKPLGVDPWPLVYGRLQAGRETSWYHACQTEEPHRLAAVVSLAEQRLPLGALATGPSASGGRGPQYPAHSSLGFVLQALPGLPGLGWPLIRAGLRSPVVRNRNLALKALRAWEPGSWPAEAGALLGEALKVETNAATRKLIGELMSTASG